jgi:CheY-like chemotaxis protein
VIRVYLPVHGSREDKVERPSVPQGEHGRVLLAEADPMVRNMATAMLSRLGYEVVQAKDGSDAVEIFRAGAQDFRCVILDVTMPVMDGWEAMRDIRALRPGIPVLLVSGYEESQVITPGVHDSPDAFIQKPFRLNDLKLAFDKCLGC